MPLRRRAREPLVSLRIALPDSTPRQIHSAEVILRRGKLLFRRATIPGDRFGVDLQASPTLFISHAQLILGGRVAFFRQSAKAFLSLRNTALRGLAGIANRLRRILRNT